MSAATDKLHREWLRLIDVSGPFLTLPVLGEVFPQGLDGIEPGISKRVRAAHEEWTSNNERRQPDRSLHRAWVEFVLDEVLGWPREELAEGAALPPALIVEIPEHGVRLRPDLALMDHAGEGDAKPRVLIAIWPPEQDLERAAPDKRWAASPGGRMAELLRGAGVRLGLVTNGEQWMLVDAPRGETAAFITWEAALWLDEPLTLRAFVTLLGAMRILGESEERTLEALLARSKNDQAEVTTKLGNQVRHAVELLVRSIDRADRASDGELLAGVSDEDLYEAAITVMMRLVFLLFAEDQRPPLVGGTPLYTENYAVSPLRDQLRASTRDSEDVLERRHDAWARLLAVFRLVHAGSEHEDMRFPPYGGSLFDPDRFPFLEGRSRKTRWVDDPADPLLIDNRTVLHLLDSIQQLGGQRISFRSLDVEQIGHVYENLLGHMARRAGDPVLALQGKLEPEVSLAELEERRQRGEDALVEYLKAATGKSASALAKALAASPDLQGQGRLRLLEACANDNDLLARVLPFAGLVRDDDAGRPLVIPAGGRYVTAGSDRKNLGAHYTPRSLTEPIVRYALEPLVYDGPAEGKPAAEWMLHSPPRLLSLKICDPAMGSGAFLVQACRYLSERLVEAWDAIETQAGGKVRITPEGRIASGDPGEELLPIDRDERLAVARRIVADRCLYGVDKNHLAVEMAKLSLWLTTLQKDRPFTFVDHALRGGDSLLGIASLDQLAQWSLTPKPAAEIRQSSWFTRQVHEALEEATALRERITASDVRSVSDATEKTALLHRSEMLTGVLRLGADLLVAAALHPDKNQRAILAKHWQAEYSVALQSLQMVTAGQLTPEGARPTFEALDRLRAEADRLLGGHQPFHWPLGIPEVFAAPRLRGESPGFAAMVGNPPFLGGGRISTQLGDDYFAFLRQAFPSGKGQTDLCAYFFLRAFNLTRQPGFLHLIATNTIAQGDTRAAGLEHIVTSGGNVVRAVASAQWPGNVGVQVSTVMISKGDSCLQRFLDESEVIGISPMLELQFGDFYNPMKLWENKELAFSGAKLDAIGFVLSDDDATQMIDANYRNAEVIRPFLGGEDFTTRPDQSASRWAIDFFDWPLERAESYLEPMARVRGKVLPQRMSNKREAYRKYWWQYAEKRVEMYDAIRDLDFVLVCCIVAKHLSFVLLPNDRIFSKQLGVVATDDMSLFGLLQSAIHEVWARKFSGTLETRLSYTLTDAFGTFPFPENRRDIFEPGGEYHQARRDWMLLHSSGLTTFYNDFHDANVNSASITSIRALHSELDRAVLKEYGWSDIQLEHDFRDTPQGERFTISATDRNEIIGRLLELNHQRHAEEVALGLVDESGKILKKKPRGAGKNGAKRKSAAAESHQPALVLE